MAEIGPGIPKPVAPEQGLAAARQAASRDPAEFFEERASQMPLIVQGSIPRRVSPLARAAACGGNFLSFFGSFWLFVSTLLMVVAIGVLRELSWFPVVFTALFVAVGSVLFWLGVNRGLRAMKLVTHGRLTWALVNHVERRVSTSRDSDGRTTTHVSYNVSFMYRPEGDIVRFAEVLLNDAERIRDEKFELLVYDPNDPARVEFADLLPGGLRINEMGETTESGARNLVSLLPFVIAPLGPIFGLLILPQFQP